MTGLGRRCYGCGVVMELPGRNMLCVNCQEEADLIYKDIINVKVPVAASAWEAVTLKIFFFALGTLCGMWIMFFLTYFGGL